MEHSLGVFGCNFPLHRYRAHAINYMTVRLRSVYDSCSGYLLSHDYTVPVEYGRHVHPTDAALTEYLVFFFLHVFVRDCYHVTFGNIQERQHLSISLLAVS